MVEAHEVVGMRITSENHINESLAKIIDLEVQNLAASFKGQQAVEDRREVIALDQSRGHRTRKSRVGQQ